MKKIEKQYVYMKTIDEKEVFAKGFIKKEER